MKKTLLILGGIFLVCFLLVVRLFFRQQTSMGDERVWFAKAVGYEFSANVDSIRMLNPQTGRLWCHITSGSAKSYREDSLKQSFKVHDMLYFIIKQDRDSITFLLPNADLVERDDSVVVSSKNNSVRVFRGDSAIANDEFAKVLTGFGRPFFLK